MTSVLVIDDVPSVLRSVEVALEQAAMTVFAFTTFEAARETLETESIQVVITDILMPEKDGLEVIADVRRMAPHVKIIAMSGGGSLLTSQEALSASRVAADGLLRKPFDREELMDVLLPLLEG